MAQPVTMRASALELRRRLLQLVGAYPGLHLRDLARRAETSEALAEYHLHALVEIGTVEVATDGVFKRFYGVRGPTPPEEDRALVGILRQQVPLQIALVILDRGEATQQELTDELHLAKSTVSYHVGKLLAQGFLKPAPHGRGLVLADARRVERLLLRWEPPPDATDRFSRLWQGFYKNRRGA